MKPETKKYLHKRKQIIKIIESKKISYQEKDEDGMLYDCNTIVGFWDARDMAREILACVGINEPDEVTKKEGSGYAIG